MKLRTVKNDIDVPKKTNKRTEVVYQVKVITPIYGGGVEAGVPDMEVPIRASAIRGQLRYWWRFLQLQKCEKNLPDEKLFKMEREVWGGMGDDESSASKVFIRCRLTNEISKESYYSYKERNLHDPKYALFPAEGNRQQPAKKLIRQGVEFELIINFSKELKEEAIDDINKTIRWWASFGGIGSRTRRGLGSVEVSSKCQQLLAPITTEEARQCHCDLRQINGNEINAAMSAWKEAVGKLQNFRQGSEGRKGRGRGRGRSKWPEPDSIRKITTSHSTKKEGCNDHKPNHLACISFPRAVFGLPIIFKFKDDSKCGDPYQTELRPDNSKRMASPLILKAMAIENGKYAAAALRLPYQHAHTMSVTLENNSSNTNEQNDNLPETYQSGQWWTNGNAQQIPPMKDRGTDALSAFMNFFNPNTKTGGQP